jgi:hypothetical protein
MELIINPVGRWTCLLLIFHLLFGQRPAFLDFLGSFRFDLSALRWQIKSVAKKAKNKAYKK